MTATPTTADMTSAAPTAQIAISAAKLVVPQNTQITANAPIMIASQTAREPCLVTVAGGNQKQ
jgi:hypothetical protein